MRWVNFLFLPVLWYNLRVAGVVRMSEAVGGPAGVLKYGFCEPLSPYDTIVEASVGLGPVIHESRVPDCFDMDTYVSPVPCQLSNPCMQLPEFASSLDTPLAVVWRASEGDLLIAMSLVILMIEVMRYTQDATQVLLRRFMGLGILLFAMFESLVNTAFASSTFLIIALILLFDVVAGFWVTFRIHMAEPVDPLHP